MAGTVSCNVDHGGGPCDFPGWLIEGPWRKTECEGHIEAEPDRYADLIARYDDNPVGIIAELAKKNQERKLMHEMLSTYGIKTTTSQGRELCLIARLAIALEALSEDT